MTLLNEICDSSRLVCVFSPIFYWIATILANFWAKSRMTLWRERGLEVGRLEFSRRKAVAGEGGGQREAGRNTQLCFGEDEETQAGRDRARHSCVLVRMKKHKVKTTGYCGGTKEDEDRAVLLSA